MENNYREVYEARTILPGEAEYTSFYFDTFEQADLWLSDFDNGEISCMVVDTNPEAYYEEMNRIFEFIDEERKEED